MSAFMAAFRGPNSELKKLPPYSPFLNIVKQAISALKLAIKADISRPTWNYEAESMNISLQNIFPSVILASHSSCSLTPLGVAMRLS